MKHLKYLLGISLLIVATACEYNEDALPVNISEVTNNTGAYLRIISVAVPAIDLTYLHQDSSAYRIVGELYDRREGNDITTVQFFVSRTTTGRTLAEVPLKTYQRSAFTPSNDYGNLPRATIDVKIGEIITALGIPLSDVRLNDAFRLRWVVNLSNGKSFTVGDFNPAIGGAFFNSPYQAVVNVVQSVLPNRFVGSYTFTQNAPSTGLSGGFGNGFILRDGATTGAGQQTFTATLTIDPANTLDGRVFTARPTPATGFVLNPINFRVRLAIAAVKANNRARLAINNPTGLGCGLGIAYGPETINTSNFDQDNDATFTLVIRENTNLDCGFPATHVAFTVTKN